MKRILALLLAILMLCSLLACGKKTDTTDTTGGNAGGNVGSGNGQQQIVEGFENAADNYEQGKDYSDATGNASDKADGNIIQGNEIIGSGEGDGTGEVKFANNNDLINPAFAGKTIQVYGWSSAAFDDIEDMGKGSFVWMMRAAIDEWAAMNKVTVVYEGDYDQNTILGAINSGEKPDLLLHCTKMPIVASSGVVRPFTDAEYAQLADTCGSAYLDVVSYKGKSCGVNYPWSGNSLFYYNKTVFEKYGVKSPKDYYMEGTWTWDNAQKCFDEITAKLKADGSRDYGNSSWNVISIPYKLKENNDGTVTPLQTSEEYRKYYEIQYHCEVQTGSVGTYAYSYFSTSPRPVTQIFHAELYNFEHLNQTLDNGDVIETIYPPVYSYESEKVIQYSQAFFSFLSSCDENEATLALMTYLLRVGMRYMSDFSLGMYKCDYEGMRGASVYSKGWKDNFEQILADRQETFDTIEDWDQEMYEKMIKDIADSSGFIGRYYANQPQPKYGVPLLPPASEIPIRAQEWEAWAETYNERYAN